MTASAGGVVSGAGPASLDSLLKRREKWQERVMELIDAVPEPSGASALVRNTIDKVVFRVEGQGIKKADVESINRLISNFEGGRAGMLIWQVGECFPSWKFVGDEVEWQVFSPLEIEVKPRATVQIRDQNGKFTPISPGIEWFRMWQPDPAYRYRSWSVHRSLIDLMESMYVAQLADTAFSTSRLAGAGLLYWPTDLPSLPLRDGRPEPGSREQLQAELTTAMMDSITARNSSDAVVPLIVFGDPTVGSFEPKHILMERTDDATAFANRMDAYAQRYAKGVELPIESVQGMGPANHWSAWVINEDKWRFYISPLANMVAKSLMRNFVGPWLANAGYSPEQIRKANVIADGSDIISKPDKSDKAIKLAEIGGYLNQDAVIRESGFDPETDKADGSEPTPPAPKTLKPLPAQFRDTSPL